MKTTRIALMFLRIFTLACILMVVIFVLLLLWRFQEGVVSSSVAPDNSKLQSELNRIGIIYMKNKNNPNVKETDEEFKKVESLYRKLQAAVKSNKFDDDYGELLMDSKIILS